MTPPGDPAAASAVAAAYIDAPCRRHPLVAAAYDQLVTESDRLFQRLTAPDRPDRVRVAFTSCPAPYAGADELIRSVNQDRLLEVTTVAAAHDGHHPVMGNDRGGAYDRFRGVHDVLGHARLRHGFDGDGEFTVWRSQERFHSPAGPLGARHRAPRTPQRAVDDRPARRPEGDPPRPPAPSPIGHDVRVHHPSSTKGSS